MKSDSKLTKVLAFLFFLILIVLYITLSLKHSRQVNIHFEDNKWGDQLSHMVSIEEIHSSNFRYLGDRNRMPLYDFIQAAFYSPQMTREELFQQGKLINIFLSLLLIIVIFYVNSKYLKTLSNTVFVLIVSFSLFLPKAAYIQPEILYYTLSYIAFLFFLKTIKTGEYKSSLLAGIFAALSYLTKATILLGFSIFLFFCGTILTIRLVRTINNLKVYRDKSSKILIHKLPTKISKPLLNLALPILAFLLILSPYIIQNYKIYEKYFFNQATNIYAWYDYEKWTEVIETRKKVTPSPQETRLLIKDKKNGPVYYFQNHSLTEIFSRIRQGINFHLTEFVKSYARIPFYISLYYASTLSFLCLSNRNIKAAIFNKAKKNLIMLSFIISYFTLHFLSFSWYWFVGGGPRFILGLFLPFLFLIFSLLDHGVGKDANQKKVTIVHKLALLLLVTLINTITIPVILNQWAGD